MKQISTYLLGILCIATIQVSAQSNITNAEYFYDIDPGVGSAIPISITTGISFDISIALVQGFTFGIHTISVRAKNFNGDWGFAERRQFFVPFGTTTDPPVADIFAMEYFIDDDPGFGGGTSIVISSGSLVDLPNQILAASTLPAGFHTVVIRSMNTDGVWGFGEKREFYIPFGTTTDPPAVNMVELEYFFDSDLGTGNETAITISAGMGIDINYLIPQSLPEGYHTLFVRAKNANGSWGFWESRTVIIKTSGPTAPVAADISKMEYYFDGVDPGVGSAIDLPITTGPLVDLNPVNVPTSPSLVDGQHNITFRAQNVNGIWGLAETSTFDVLDDCTQPTADFNPQVACAGEAISFVDLSTNLQPDAQYRWYFDGDNIADDFTSGTTSFTFTNPGTYNIGLAISQGTICYDSIGYTIDVIAKPVVLFSASGLIIDIPTNFSVASSNVDPLATWEWDFNNDAVIDDNTAGSTSYIYTVATSYTASVRVTDGLGCETTYSQIFLVGDGTGGGGGTPEADFIANSVCDAETMQFIDVSSNIPPAALYSWDFDNDGNVDDNTSGTTTFTYPGSGDYTAKLSIDVGGGVIKVKTKQVTIKPIPSPVFSVLDVCDGSMAIFTDATTGIISGTTYNWDFDGNGSIDSNTQGDETYTYAQPGQYTALLLVDNGSGCFASYTQQVNVIPVPVPDFTSAGSCTGSTVTFQDQSSGWTTQSVFDWDFDGDGAIDYTGKDGAGFVYSAPGDYDAKLIIDNGNGCTTEVIKTVSITQYPTADFDVTVGCEGDPITFSDLSTNQVSAIYSWDFTTDGTEDDNTIGNTTFTFSAPGTYTTTLTVDNGSGCNSTVSKTFDIIAIPQPDFIVSGGCSGSEFIFFDESTGLEASAAYSWDFDGDGTEDYDQPGDAFYTYAIPGTYDATLTIDNGSGCLLTKIETLVIAEVPEPDFEILSTCIGQPSQFVDLSNKVSSLATYSWDFDGDGVEDDTTVGSTTYTFDVYKPYVATLTINNGLGCIKMVDVIVDFTGAAAPDFKVGQTCLNEEVVFTDISAELAIGAVYSWDFNGDGLEDSAHPGTETYTFTRAGTYNASLTIFNADLCSATRTIPVVVSELPDVDLGPDVQLCTEGTVTLDAGAGYASYFWKGGSTEQTLTVDTFGEYWVSITDVKGCTNLDTILVRLKNLPVAQFEYEIIYSPTDGVIINFENKSTEADAANPWMWDFGDGGVSDDENPSYNYTEFSFYKETPYIVCLTATDRCGIQDTFCVDILLSPLSLMEDADNLVQIYPNPGSGLFHINESSGTNFQNITIMDGNGRLVDVLRSIDRSDVEIDISNNTSGIYYLLIELDEKQLMKRVILEKKQ